MPSRFKKARGYLISDLRAMSKEPRPLFKPVNDGITVNEEKIRDAILGRLPPLIKMLDMPYTVDQVTLDLGIYDDIPDLTERAGLEAGVFEADFDDDNVYMKAALTKSIIKFIINKDRIFLLDSILVHELLHHDEGKLTPRNYYYPGIVTKKEYPLTYDFFVEFMVNEFRDAIVYSITPRKYLSLFQLYKFGEMCVSMVTNEEKFHAMLHDDGVDYVDVKFAPIIGLPMLYNLYIDMELMSPLFINYGKFVEQRFPDRLPFYLSSIQILDDAFVTIKKERTYDDVLTRYNVDKLYVMMSELPPLTFQMYIQGVKSTFDSALRPFINKERTRRKVTRAKLGRNDPCPCGSGLKYKKCCYLKDFMSRE